MPLPVYQDEDVALLERARLWRPGVPAESLDVERLGALAAAEGIDLATAVLYVRLRESARHAGLVRRVEACGGGVPTLSGPAPVLCVVPGFLWRQHADTGADGALFFQIAQALGLEAARIDLPELDSMEANAARLLAWLRGQRRPVVMVSLSKAGCDVLAAMAMSNAHGALDRDFAHVRAWINFSGSIQGNRLVQWLCDRPLRAAAVRLMLRVRGYRFDHIREFARREASAGWPTVPGQTRVIHAIAFPLRRHLTHRWADKGYTRLEPLGPNDGCGLLLGDVTGWPGEVYPVWGTDHYFQPRWDVRPVVRGLILEALAGPGATG